MMMNKNVTFILITQFLTLLAVLSAYGQAGILDPDFDPGSGADNFIITSAVQPDDGKMIIGGFFMNYNGEPANRILRLNLDGSRDMSFDIGLGANSSVLATAIQPDGKILIGGFFTSYNGIAANRIIRLNPDASIDTSFDIGTGFDGAVEDIIVQPDGKILVSGLFWDYNGTARSSIARLEADGTIDLSFDPGDGTWGIVYTMGLQPDGKVVIGGLFTEFDGDTHNHILRLNADGSVDTDFNSGDGVTESGAVRTVLIQPDGKIVVGGFFFDYDGTPINHLVRLNNDGTIDTGFDTGTGPSDLVLTLSLQNDNKILVGGSFDSFNGSTIGYFIRTNIDGSFDDSFIPASGGANNTVWTSAFIPGGTIFIGGPFSAYDGITLNSVARILLNNFGILCPADTAFTATEGSCETMISLPIPELTGDTYNNALYFDGLDDYINFPIVVAADPLALSGSAFSLTAWIEPTLSGEPYQAIISKASAAGAAGGYELGLQNDGRLMIYIDGILRAQTDAGLLTADNWHHIAIVGEAAAYRFYIDGVEVASTDLAPHALPPAETTALSIGVGAQDLSSAYFQGKIDEVSFWNTALSEVLINEGANGGFLSTATGIVAYYKFNQYVAGCNNTGMITLIGEVGPDAVLFNFELNSLDAPYISNWTTGAPSLGSSLLLTNDVHANCNEIVELEAGLNQILWTVSDAIGNFSSCTQNVTIATSLVFSDSVFTEVAPFTTGEIENTITISSDCDIFTGIVGEDFLITDKATVENVPLGLTAELIKNADNNLIFVLNGEADSHEVEDSIDNLTLIFDQTAFSIPLSTVLGSVRDNLEIVFLAPIGGGGLSSEPPTVEPVTNFTAVAQNTTSILLNWRASANAERYALYRQAQGSSEWVRVATLSAGVREYLDTELESDTRYRYRLDARLNTLVASAFTRETTYPEAPALSITQNACSTNPVARIETETTHQSGLINWYISETAAEPFTQTQSIFQTPEITETTTFYATAQGQKYESEPRVSVTITIVETPVANLSSLTTRNTQFSCGETAMISVEDQGEGIVYLWLKNGQRIAETEVPEFEVSESGAYAVVISRGGCEAASGNMFVKLNHRPVARITSQNPRFCQSGIIVAEAVEDAIFEWFKDGVSFVTTTENRLEIDESGEYSVKVTQYGCEATSETRFAEVLPLPENVTLEVSNSTLCPGENVILTATEVEGATYRWTRNGRSIGFSENNNQIEREGGGEYRVRISYPGFYCFSESEIVEVVVSDVPQARVLSDGSELVLTPLRPEPIASIDWYYEFRGEREALPEFANQERIVPNKGTGFYGAMVVYTNGCEMEAVANRFFAEGNITGNEPESATDLRIYPNPASSVVTISDVSRVFTSGDLDIEVYDAIGRLVIQKRFTQSELQSDIQLNINNLANGSYTLRLNGEAATIVKKLIKE